VIVGDTSVVVAALVRSHAHHLPAVAALRGVSAAIGHTLVETYSVLTRLPEPHRVEPNLVVTALEQRFDTVLQLDDETLRRVPGVLAAAGVRGGPTYDGVIALTASHHDATLLTLDERALMTYRACGASFRLLIA
jgi:predicted nucleic acid-binding protein